MHDTMIAISSSGAQTPSLLFQTPEPSRSYCVRTTGARRCLSLLAVLMPVALALTACDVSEVDGDAGDTGDAGDGGAIEIAGSYTDDFGTMHAISDTEWLTSFGGVTDTYTISQFSNQDDFAVAQNAATNGFNPEKWSKFNWAFDTQGSAYYCQVAYAADTEAGALATVDADPNSLTAGCSGFAWSKLTP